jgi:O-acetyl-ADP-ribose deacetylase (regulator of RNase III)
VAPRIRVRQGDLTMFEGDAIINAANTDLVLETGVSGAIRQAGGPTIQDECARQAPVALGQAVLTGAGKLSVRHVIHAAIMGDEPTSLEAVRRATTSALRVAAEHGLTRLGMPILGSGLGRMTIEEAATAMLTAIRESPDADQIDVIVLYGYRDEHADELEALLG